MAVTWQPDSPSARGCAPDQEGLTTAAGTGRVTLVRTENGEQLPRYGTLVALAGALGRAVGDGARPGPRPKALPFEMRFLADADMPRLQHYEGAGQLLAVFLDKLQNHLHQGVTGVAGETN
ncbi:MAG: hypothetical protein Q8R28_15515 [Dehalococcoidia bacterium]|nr:hypothetical protein [Dehalococcoidia bacterium]